LIKTWAIGSIPSNFFTRVRSCWEEAPWDSSQLTFKVGWLPTATLAFTLLLVNSEVSTISSE